jgi:hypothetical protein
MVNEVVLGRMEGPSKLTSNCSLHAMASYLTLEKMENMERQRPNLEVKERDSRWSAGLVMSLVFNRSSDCCSGLTTTLTSFISLLGALGEEMVLGVGEDGRAGLGERPPPAVLLPLIMIEL